MEKPEKRKRPEKERAPKSRPKKERAKKGEKKETAAVTETRKQTRKKQAQGLRRLGCRRMQGYWFARPMQPEELEHHLLSGEYKLFE